MSFGSIFIKLIIYSSLTSCLHGQELSKDKLSVVDFESRSVFEDNGKPFVISKDVRIAYYKEYVLYRTTIIGSTSSDSSPTNTSIDLDDTTGVRYYKYFVMKKDADSGRIYSSLYQNPKTVKLKKFLMQEGLNFDDNALFKLELGSPDKVKKNNKTNEVEIEMYKNKIKGEREPDSLYRYYNKALTSIEPSFNRALDKKMDSKLWKISLIYNGKSNIGSNSKKDIRYETFWKIDRLVPSPSDEKSLMQIFDRFILEEEVKNR